MEIYETLKFPYFVNIEKKYAKNSFSIILDCQLSVKNETDQAQNIFSSPQNANKGHK